MTKPFWKRLRIPHVFTLLTFVIAAAALATWFVPSGSYERETRMVEGHERTLVVPGTYESIPKHVSLRGALIGDDVEGEATPVGLHGFLTAIPRGLEKAADIIFFIFIVGGVFGILQKSGAITALIGWMLRALGHVPSVMVVAIMLAVGIGSSTLGMGEEFIPLVPLFLLISKRLGYDRVFGLAIVLVANEVGFAAATTNPFTVNVAQGIAELPLNSGAWFRVIFFVVCMTVGVAYVLRYGARIKADPAASLMPDDDFDVESGSVDDRAFGGHHAGILLACGAIFVFILVAVQTLGWWMADMAGGFLAMGLAATIIARMPIDTAMKAFIGGMRDMLVAALVVGWARGIEVVLVDGQIMDTLVHSAASVLSSVHRYVAVVGMLVFQSTFNFLVPSGSGQAAVTMPLMAPLSDVLGITRQTAVFAYQCGDGFSNSIIPTSGYLMAMLAIGGVPYTRWVRFVLPLFLVMMALAAVFLMIAVAIGYS